MWFPQQFLFWIFTFQFFWEGKMIRTFRPFFLRYFLKNGWSLWWNIFILRLLVLFGDGDGPAELMALKILWEFWKGRSFLISGRRFAKLQRSKLKDLHKSLLTTRSLEAVNVRKLKSRITWLLSYPIRFCGFSWDGDTVDGRNPAPVDDMWVIPLSRGFYTSQVVQGFLPSTVVPLFDP